MTSSARRALLTAGAVASLILVPATAATARPLSPSPAPAAVAVAVQSVTVSPTTITAGDGAVQTITLTAPAPAGGQGLFLDASDVVYTATAGSFVEVPAGQRVLRVPFRLSTLDAATRVRTVYAQATGSTVSRSASLTVRAADPAVRAVVAFRTSAPVVRSGGTVTGTVVLRRPAPAGGIALSLWSNTAYGAHLYVPPFVLVPGGRTSASFPMEASTQVTETVHPGAYLGTSQATADLTILAG